MSLLSASCVHSACRAAFSALTNLAACCSCNRSAIVLKAGKEGLYEKQGHGARPYDNFENILFDCRGQDFKTVMSALKSNNERWGILDVTLVLQRPEGAASSATA